MKADETVTVRMPKGTADRIRAATGQPFSSLVRYIMLALLDRYESQHIPADQDSIKNIVNDL